MRSFSFCDRAFRKLPAVRAALAQLRAQHQYCAACARQPAACCSETDYTRTGGGPLAGQRMRTAEQVRVNTETPSKCADARINRVAPRRQRGARAQQRARRGLGSGCGICRCDEQLLRSAGGRGAAAQL